VFLSNHGKKSSERSAEIRVGRGNRTVTSSHVFIVTVKFAVKVKVNVLSEYK